MSAKSSVSRVLICGDWDADGFVSTSLLVYSQEKLGKYPIAGSAIVVKRPIEPDKFRYILGNLDAAYDLLVLLDIPYTISVSKILRVIKSHFSVKRIMYVDHHISTINNADDLNRVVDALMVDSKKSTSKIVYDALAENDVAVHERLRTFVDLVNYMDSGHRIPDNLMKLFELVKLFSKALNITRDPELWIEIVNWLAEPFPASSDSLVERARDIVNEVERRINELAVDLAVSSMKVGDFKLVDARSKWKYRGASALASKLSSILKSPVILWIDTNKEYSLLIVKAHGGKAYRLAERLLRSGAALDIAGHPNLAIVKVPRGVETKDLLEKLHEAAYYV